MKLRVRLPAALLALNWALFAVAFIWTCKAQENLLWWLRLDWAGWLGELPELMQLGTVSASTVWILWLCLTLLLTAAWLVPGAARPATAEKPTSADVEAGLPRASGQWWMRIRLSKKNCLDCISR